MSPTSFGPPFFLIAPGTPIAASPPGAGIRIIGALPAKGSPYSITERRVPELIPVLRAYSKEFFGCTISKVHV